MMFRWLCVAILAVFPAVAQGNHIRAWFRDGAGLEIHTEAAGSAQETSISGGGRIGSGVVSRTILDDRKKTVFAYDLEAEWAGDSGAVNIRIKPVGKNPDEVPTVAAVREFRGVKVGQEVRIEILENRSTGGRVWDVLRPISQPSPNGHGPTIQAMDISPPEAVKLVINGKTLAVKGHWDAGQPARLYVPGEGTYYLAWESRPNFRLAGYAEKNRLVFLMDRVYVEITCGHDILSAGSGPVWIYREAGDRGGTEAELGDAK